MGRQMLLPLLLLVVCTTAGGKKPAPPPPMLPTTLAVPVSSREAYTAFMGAFERGVYATRETVVAGHIVLKEQHLLEPPAFWHTVNVVGAAGDLMVRLYFRSDNLYLTGFKNTHGTFCFKGKQGTMPGTPTALSFTGDYGELLRSYHDLANIGINSSLPYDHARSLAQYRDRYVADTTLRPSLGFFVLSVAEAQRFPAAIGNAVAQRIAFTGGHALTIPRSLTPLAVNWWRVSCAALYWSRHGMTDEAWEKSKDAQDLKKQPVSVPGPGGQPKTVDTAAEGLSLIGPIIQSTRCSRDN